MYNLKHLSNIARQGLSDLLPAVRQAFNDDPTDDRLDQVYGPWPRRTILIMSISGIGLGWLFAWFSPDFPLKEHINWPAVVVGLLFAAVLRHYLFKTQKADVNDFPWLAASLVPATVLLMAVVAVSDIAFGGSEAAGDATPANVLIGTVLLVISDALGVAAALAIAVAALCFSRNWLQALWDLAIRLFVFKLMVWITVLILLEVGVVGPIISALLDAILGWQVPRWLPELADQLSYAGLLSVAYLAVIGATWTVCRKSFGELLDTGHVNVLSTIVDMAKDPKRKKRREERRKKQKQDTEKD